LKKNVKYESAFTLHLKDAELKSIFKDIKDSDSSVKSLKVKIEATHSGIVNGNMKFYMPSAMKVGTDSFIKPYAKPVTVNHDPHASPLGRITDAKYVSYGISKTLDSLRPVGAVDIKSIAKVQDFVKSADYKDANFKGLGHIELIAEITDEDAIKKILDRRYLTVSIGGGSNAMYCSVCGVDNKQEYCNHYPGQVYDGKDCYFISGDKMFFDHVSYVNSPADLNTNSEVLDCSDESKITILDYKMVDKGKQMNLIDFLKSKYPTYKDFAKLMEDKKLTKHVNDAAATAAKDLDYVIADEKILPIFDKAHAIASLLILQDCEIEGKDKDDMVQMIEDKLNSLCDDKFILSDELTALTKEEGTGGAAPTADTQNTVTTQGAIDISDTAINNIVSKVVDELKKSFNVSDSYAASRLKAVQRVNDSLETEVQSLTQKLRDNIVLQILTLEDKLADNDYKQKLASRNTNSLEDKLSDLIISDKKIVDKQEDSKDTALEQNSVDKGGAVQDSGTVENKDKNPVAETQDAKLTNEEIVDEYKRIIREKGLSAAKVYFQTLKDENKIPDNFTFHGVK
jgi:hypothetical protein